MFNRYFFGENDLSFIGLKLGLQNNDIQTTGYSKTTITCFYLPVPLSMYTFCNQYLYRSGLKVTQNEDEVYIEKSNYCKGYFNDRGQKHKKFEKTFPDMLKIS